MSEIDITSGANAALIVAAVVVVVWMYPATFGRAWAFAKGVMRFIFRRGRDSSEAAKLIARLQVLALAQPREQRAECLDALDNIGDILIGYYDAT